MLRYLGIRNLAVIETVELEFEPGFTVMTGETGAGKSMLVEALGLLLGGRASSDVVRTGEGQTLVQAAFEDPAGRELLVRREVTSQGRSRAFVNGALVTSAALREAAAPLVELHGQHENRALQDPASCLDILDDFAGLSAEREMLAAAFSRWQTAASRLAALSLDERERAARIELIGYQLGELDRAGPKAGEDEEIAARRRVLASADKLHRLCTEAYATLYEDDQAVLAGLSQVWRRVDELAELEPSFQSHLVARDDIRAQLEDLAASLRAYASDIDASPARLQQVEERLALLERLKRKYGPTMDEVVGRHAALRRDLADLQGAEGKTGELQAEVASAEADYLARASDLSRKRQAAAARFGRDLVGILGELAMEHTRFDVRFESVQASPSAWTGQGIDRVDFLISPNPGEDLRPLSRIASGGELSRIMLALKTMTAGDTDGRTLVFDEVDAGIGGRVAGVVGAKLRRLGGRFQVLCITHLPQLAACATGHFAIAKHVSRGRTLTTVERLHGESRVLELARMIGGAASSQAQASARELLQQGSGVETSGGREDKTKVRRAAARENPRRAGL